MKKHSIFFLAIALILAAACSKKDGLLYFKLDTPFELKQGEIASWEDNPDLKIHFSKVLSDSRCPIDAECVWAGRAEIEVVFSQTEGSSETLILIMGDNSGTSYTDKAKFGNFTVTLKAVKPEPLAGQIISPSEYAIELQISK